MIEGVINIEVFENVVEYEIFFRREGDEYGIDVGELGLVLVS